MLIKILLVCTIIAATSGTCEQCGKAVDEVVSGAKTGVTDVQTEVAVAVTTAQATRPTQIAPLDTSAPTQKHTYAILIEGLTSDLNQQRIDALKGPCSNEASDPSAFHALKHALLAGDFVCDDFLTFSYKGGNVHENGEWAPNPYSCNDTGQPTRDDVNLLLSMVKTFAARHPEAQFVVVGHSLGGFVAFQLLSSVNQGQVSQGVIKDLITIDAPVNHVSRSNLKALQAHWSGPSSIVSALRCDVRQFVSSNAASDIADVTDTNRDAITASNARLVESVQGSGVSVLTLGNAQDCIWFLTLCNYFPGEWHNDIATQNVTTANSQLFNLGTNGCNHFVGCVGDSHLAALTSAAVTKKIVAIIGAQPDD